MNSKVTNVVLGLAIVVALGAIAVAIAFAGRPNNTVQAQTPGTYSNATGVTVTGEGYVMVKPDIVYFNAGIQLKADTVSEAQKQAATKMEAITKALLAQGIKEDDIKTSSYSISPNYIYDQGKSSRLDGYNVYSAVSVTVRDMNKAGQIIDEVGKAGANQINGISFGRDKEIELINQARVSAMSNARVKAEQLAQAGGFGLGNIVNVSESGVSRNGLDYAKAVPSAGMGGDAITVIEGGQFKVTVNIQVTYAIK
jgi:uncharacterized protein YggE